MGQRPTESHGCMKWKICAGYKQEGIDLSSGEKPSNYGKTQFLRLKVVKMFGFVELAVRDQKSATHKKVHGF